MQIETLLYIILSGIIALLLALFQYWYKVKPKTNLNKLFTFLRFVSLFALLLLLVNPKIEQTNVFTENPNLVIAVDNSESVKHLNQASNATNVLDNILNNEELKQKFNVVAYSFGNDLKPLDSLAFNEDQTQINKVLQELSQIYKQTTAPTILITDGNQTLGADYEFSNNYKQAIYPIILGDTIKHVDLSIQQFNVNKYAYLKNKFPLEAILVYNGNDAVTSKFQISSNGRIIYSENINFTKTNNSKVINTALLASTVGLKTYKAELLPLNSEKNVLNNIKNFAIEVIDQKTNVAIVTDILHPDLGALKRSIESNEQRLAAFISPEEALSVVNDYQLFILYQPNQKFSELYKALNTQDKNRFIITGTQTDWGFLNQVQTNYNKVISNQSEDVQAILNTGYSNFIINNVEFEDFPPLKTSFGSININVPTDQILFQKIGNVTTETPLLFTFESNNRREAVLLGEDIWKWRSQHFLDTKSFKGFDEFFGKLIQYLASNQHKRRLNVDYESFYNGNTSVLIKAQYFNKNYEFDARESLQITVTDKSTNAKNTFPLLLKGNFYEVDLSSLKPSEYDFTVKATSENISTSGSFTILDHNIEQQFLNANVSKLQQLANNSQGASSFTDDYNTIVDSLLLDKRYVPIQKSTKKTVSFVDWKYLLALIVLSLALEWFIRKYNGLI